MEAAVNMRSLRHITATEAPVRNDNGDIIGLQVVLRDIKEDKRRTEDLEDLLVQR
jgi:hypothetical protein